MTPGPISLPKVIPFRGVMHVYVVLVWEHELNMAKHVGRSRWLIDLQIANIDAADQLAAIVGLAATQPAGPGGMAAHTPANYIKVTARNDGSFTVTNSRNGYSRSYAARP